jgi:hypothetical protein
MVTLTMTTQLTDLASGLELADKYLFLFTTPNLPLKLPCVLQLPFFFFLYCFFFPASRMVLTCKNVRFVVLTTYLK